LIQFKFINYESSSNLNNLIDLDTKSAFSLNTSKSNQTALSVSAFNFIVISNGLFSSPDSFVSGLVFRDEQGQIIRSSDILVDIYFQTDNNNLNQTCSYWDIVDLKWSTNGCLLVETTSNGFYKCNCNHTTFFALIGVSCELSKNI
jgi:hypothetical protein